MDLDMDMGVEGQGQKQGLFRELYEKLNKIVWVLKIEGRFKAAEYKSYFTGFTVTKYGHVLTCAHGGWHRWSDLTIKARLLGGTSGFQFDAEIVSVKPKWDVCVLKISLCGLEDVDCGNLGSGNVGVGENVLVIGHAKEFVGSCLVGHAAYACTENVEIRYDDFGTCYKFKSEALTNTPLYRIMGHIWNSDYFDDFELRHRNNKPDLNFEKNLQPRLPIIQCSGFIGGLGTSGAPMFNIRGEIVGMLVLESDGYQVGVHVTALKKFLEDTFHSDDDTEASTEMINLIKGVSEASTSINISKKRKN